MIFELNTDNQAQEILEGQRRYREQMATQYAVGRLDAQKEYQEKLEKVTEEKDKAIEEKDKVIEEKEKKIEELQKLVEELKNK